MEIKQLQDKISKVFLDNAKRDNIEIDDNYLVLKLTEELGEFVQSYIVHQKKCRPEKYLSKEESKRELSKELSDVLGLIFIISKKFNIDIEEVLVKKFITKEWMENKETKI